MFWKERLEAFSAGPSVPEFPIQGSIGFPKAMDVQARILKRVPLEQPEMLPSQKQLATSICIQFGEHYLAEKEYVKAVRSYKEALSFSPMDNQVVGALRARHCSLPWDTTPC